MDEHGLGKLVQEARQNAGLTQPQLCQKANISFSTLTKIERGAIKTPSVFTVHAIANALNLSIDALLLAVSIRGYNRRGPKFCRVRSLVGKRLPVRGTRYVIRAERLSSIY